MSTPDGSPSIPHFNRHPCQIKLRLGTPESGIFLTFLYKTICIIIIFSYIYIVIK